jgi:GAF domain-containing protein
MKQQQHILELEDYAVLAKTCATARVPEDVFVAIQDVVGRRFGFGLLTMLMLSPDGDEVQRIFTTDPINYPLAGRERLGMTLWGEHVLVQQVPFLGEDRTAVQWAFPADFELIKSLGLGATINVPIVALGKSLGSLNILHSERSYSRSHLLAACTLAPYLMVPFLHAAGYLDDSCSA